MVKIFIDEYELEVDPGTSILKACEKLAIEVPTFCYHPRLKVAGNCRMCLVEVEKSPKTVASCATPVAEGMVVRTNSTMVEKARKGVLELLLINHPLDCPICDQGGECDLQDLTLNYGPGSSRYKFYKRAVPNKYMGPFIKTVMNRCIHCMRCVRFITDVAGIPEIGSSGRGENTEVISYLDKALTSELSGNIIDLCPVGALTNKPYAFHGRPWELTHTNSIDVTDAVGSNISLDTKDGEVLRVTPRINEAINEEWISDKTRFFYDGLKTQRLDTPYIKINGKLTACSWVDAFESIKAKISTLKPVQMAAIAGDLADQESQLALRMLLDSYGINNRDCRPYGALIPYNQRSQYLFNSTIQGVEQADAILLIGTNPRLEATILNARIRKAVVNNSCKVALIGMEADLTYPYQFLGDAPSVLDELISGAHEFANVLKSAKNPIIILGMECFRRADLDAILYYANKLHEKFGVAVNVLHIAAACVGGLDAGFTPIADGKNTREIVDAAENGSIKLVYLLNADMNVDFGDAFVVYQGHHGDLGAHKADVILPGLAFSEKNSTYVNTEGVSQLTCVATPAPGDAKEDWKIIRALSENLGMPLPFDNIEQLRKLLPLSDSNSSFVPFTVSANKFSKDPFKPFIENYYMHDVISRNSKNMANAISEIMEGSKGAI
jgi:NADH-quinone oxidoreductase subunit G